MAHKKEITTEDIKQIGIDSEFIYYETIEDEVDDELYYDVVFDGVIVMLHIKTNTSYVHYNCYSSPTKAANFAVGLNKKSKDVIIVGEFFYSSIKDKVIEGDEVAIFRNVEEKVIAINTFINNSYFSRTPDTDVLH